MSELCSSNGPHRIGFEGHYVKCVSGQSQKLNFVRLAFSVHVNHRTDVTGLQLPVG